MAKSSRASKVKKNNQNLKKKVFGPVEAARNERLGNKLLELAQQPKPPRAEMEVDEANGATNSEAKEESKRGTEDIDMDADQSAPTERSNRSYAREKVVKSARIEKKRVRKTKNRIVFPPHPKKAKTTKKG